ncbi:hypothetical protein RRG08_012425 [Elysia crispata]|uniref:Peptidase S1 domain-containing protein n=1 Tax=Elysia crispata TaxID=231223 RepID=A0AAE1DXL1_9GAST|nr:hypothetical protein RRG08_012425 [Elysia crispata]
MRIPVCLPGPTPSGTATLLWITCLSCFVGLAVSQSCDDKCNNTLNYYNSILRSPVLVQYYHQLCLTRCYEAARAPWPYPGVQQETQPWHRAPPPPPPPTTTTTPPPLYPSWWQPQPPIWPQPGDQQTCGKQTRNTFRVIGGTRAEECEFPWMVGVIVRSFWCGGVILDTRHILTAAHCLKQKSTSQVYPASAVTVTVGSSKTSRQRKMAVQRVNVHPSHIPNINDYDVAVLTLAGELTYSDCVAPLCLPPPGSSPFNADFCVAAGWGITQDNGHGALVQDLQKVVLPLVPQHLCLRVYDPAYINDLKLCAGDLTHGGVDTCKGDSGGPLMCKIRDTYYTYGIVSFGSVCGAVNQPGIYTNVVDSRILDFINRALRQ